MKTVILTDGRYRSSLAVVRTLGEAGYRVVVTQTHRESPHAPASFVSRFASESHWIDGSCKDAEYGDRLLELLKEYDRPVLFCTGADTLNMVSRRRAEFAGAADFLIAEPEVLDALNDKQQVHNRAESLSLPVPQEYGAAPSQFPVVIKPHCGEKAGLKARDRYVIAHDEAEFKTHYAAMQQYDPSPIVQEQIVGAGEGVNLLLDQNSRLICGFCHRRLREYPVSGGPSTCCVSFYDKDMIDHAYRLLSSFGFVGMAMVEFKGGRVLEVNPRVWGSFPMSACCQSPFAVDYVRAAAGETLPYEAENYQTGVKMRFLFNDGAATLGYLKKGRIKEALGGIRDFFAVREALYRKDDREAYRTYLKNSLRDR